MSTVRKDRCRAGVGRCVNRRPLAPGPLMGFQPLSRLFFSISSLFIYYLFLSVLHFPLFESLCLLHSLRSCSFRKHLFSSWFILHFYQSLKVYKHCKWFPVASPRPPLTFFKLSSFSSMLQKNKPWGGCGPTKNIRELLAEAVVAVPILTLLGHWSGEASMAWLHVRI